MSEEQNDLTSAYRRAGFGLAIAAIGWTLALLFAKGQKEMSHWLVPIAAAAISVLCFSRSRQTEKSES